MIFEFDATSDVPLWVQLRQRLVHLINTGHYNPGDQLPTVRGLASELSINYNTVNKAYMSMTQDGYITSTRGRGVFVSAANQADEELVFEAEDLFNEFMNNCRDLGLSSWEIRKLLAKRLRELDASKDVTAEKNAEYTSKRQVSGRERQNRAVDNNTGDDSSVRTDERMAQ